jgi:uncharacterized protein (DUF2147 family)
MSWTDCWRCCSDKEKGIKPTGPKKGTNTCGKKDALPCQEGNTAAGEKRASDTNTKRDENPGGQGIKDSRKKGFTVSRGKVASSPEEACKAGAKDNKKTR